MGRESGSQQFNPNVAFGPKQIIRYPKEAFPENLGHTFRRIARRNGKSIPLKTKIMPLLSRVHENAVKEFESIFTRKFDPFNLGTGIEFARRLYHDSPKFIEACTLLQLGEKERKAISYPWANFIAADEAGYKSTDSGWEVLIAPRHFYETQALKVADLPIQSISVSSVLKTTDGKYVIGLRGGHRWPNTYHVFASALLLTEGIMDGTQSISDFNLNNVLLPETGVGAKEIEKVILFSRIADWTGTDPIYNFLVELKITMDELNRLFSNHRENSDYPQRTKYQSLKPIQANYIGVSSFLDINYKGLLEDRPRQDDERAILFPGAVTLFSLLSDMFSINTLERLHKRGFQ